MLLPSKVLVDADVFFSYLVEDELSSHSEKILNMANAGSVKLQAASEVYDDVISALRSGQADIEAVIELLNDLRKLPHDILPTTLDIAAEAMNLYSQHGGARRLHYFDSFHVATAKVHELPLVTSDRYILYNSAKLGIASLDLSKV